MHIFQVLVHSPRAASCSNEARVQWHGPLTLSSCESGCSRLCCWMAMGGGRGTASAPSSPSSSPQLCMPDDEDFESVPLLRPSFRPLWNQTNICSLYSRPNCKGQLTEMNPKRVNWESPARTATEIPNQTQTLSTPIVTAHSLPASQLLRLPTWIREGPPMCLLKGPANITH